MGTAAHRQFAGHDPVTVAIITVSGSRTPETDTNRQHSVQTPFQVSFTVQ